MNVRRMAACAAGALALGAIGYGVVALACTRSFARRSLAGPGGDEPVSLLVPLYGDEPGLEQICARSLRSFLGTGADRIRRTRCGGYRCRSRNACGPRSPNATSPSTPARLGPSRIRKVASLLAMLPHARHGNRWCLPTATCVSIRDTERGDRAAARSEDRRGHRALCGFRERRLCRAAGRRVRQRTVRASALVVGAQAAAMHTARRLRSGVRRSKRPGARRARPAPRGRSRARETRRRVGAARRALAIRSAHDRFGCGPARVVAAQLRWHRTIRAVAPAGYVGLFLTYPIPLALLAAVLAARAGAVRSSAPRSYCDSPCVLPKRRSANRRCRRGSSRCAMRSGLRWACGLGGRRVAWRGEGLRLRCRRSRANAPRHDRPLSHDDRTHRRGACDAVARIRTTSRAAR